LLLIPHLLEFALLPNRQIYLVINMRTAILLTALLPTLTIAAPVFGFGNGNNPFSKGDKGGKGSKGQDTGADSSSTTTSSASSTTGSNAAGSSEPALASASGGGNSGGGSSSTTSNSLASGGPAGESTEEAVLNWMRDTGIVSNFLDTAEGLSGNDYISAAKIALAAEKDELNHKAVLDATRGIGDTASVKQANNVLATQGNFQKVVDLLQDMVNRGDQSKEDVQKINDGRCVNVLPNIDKYFAAAGVNVTSVRPKACQ
jgi:hypothetical protein